MATPSKHPRAEVEQRILALAGETRPRMRLDRRRTVAVAAVVATTALATIRPRSDWRTLPVGPFVAVSAVVGVLALVGLGVAASVKRFTGAPARALVGIAIAAPPAYALTTAVHPLHGVPEVPAPPTSMCLAMAAMVAAIGLGALVVAFRHAVPVAPRPRGAALGAAAGAWAGLAMHLRCPSSDPVHILVGHAAPIALVALIGAAVASRFLRP